MKKVFVCLLGVLLCAVPVFGAVCPALAAEGGSLGETAAWSFAGGRLTISGKGDIPNGEIYNEIYPVRDRVSEVVVENGVTNLGAGAFQSCTALIRATLPSTLVKLPNSCFNSCTALGEIVIPQGVQWIDTLAFAGCTALGKVHLPDSLHRIGGAAFQGCTALSGIRLPAALCTIEENAFKNTGLKSLVLPSSVRWLGGWAFAQCAALKNAVLSSGLRMLPENLFQNSDLDTLVIPESIRDVQESTLYNCTVKNVYYEGAQKELSSVRVAHGSGFEDVAGTWSKVMKNAAVHTAAKKDLGDIDGTAGVSAADARAVLRAAVNLSPIAPGSLDFYRADINRDAAVTAADARLVLRAAVKLEDLQTLAPAQPKAVSDADLEKLSAFTGTADELLRQYDVERFYPFAAVFGNGRDYAVLLIHSGKVYFSRRFTPTVTNARLEAVTAKDPYTVSDLETLDPDLGRRVYDGLRGSVPAAYLICSREGNAYLFESDGGRIFNCLAF